MKRFKEISIDILAILGIIILMLGLFYVGVLCAAFDIEMMITVSPWFGLAFLPFSILLIFQIIHTKNEFKKEKQ